MKLFICFHTGYICLQVLNFGPGCFIAYRQKAHMVGIPEFKWLERYQQMIGRKSFISTGRDCFIKSKYPPYYGITTRPSLVSATSK